MIHGYAEPELVEVLSAHLSPSQEINDPEKLIGRDKYLTRIRRSLLSPGRHVFIFGDRGVGKTSLAKTCGKLAATEDNNFIYIACSEESTFFEIVHSVAASVVRASSNLDSKASGLSLGLSIPGVAGASLGVNSSQSLVAKPESFADCVELLKIVRARLKGQIVIVVDELDRIKSASEKMYFADLLKNVSAIVEDVRFIFCGIGANVDEVLGSHLSVGRMFEPVEVEKLSHDNLWKIIEAVSEAVGVKIDRGYLLRIGIISDGFPHYVHLIGECLFYAMHDDPEVVTRCEQRHFAKALSEALQKAEPTLRKIYQMATEKTKNQIEYEDALWSLADRTSTRRQIKEIYESSYIAVNKAHDVQSALSREYLNKRFLALKKDSHANIVVGHGSGWFSFRENVVRGYVRLKAESQGVPLVKDPTN